MSRTQRRFSGNVHKGFYENQILWVTESRQWVDVEHESKEYWKRYHRYHGDAWWPNYFPSVWYRKFRHHQERQKAKIELIRYVQREDYEPMVRTHSFDEKRWYYD